MSENVSRLLDGDLGRAETAQALGEVAAQPELRDRYTLYALTGDVLRGNSTPDDGFTMRILQRMRREGVAIDPDYDPLA